MPAADRPKRDPKKLQSFPVEPPPPKSGGSWTASKILTKSSGVANADIQAFLLTCVTGWDSYDLEEQRGIINTLPADRRFFVLNPETNKFTCPLAVDFVATDPHLKRATIRFKRDLDNGFYTQTWQRQSRQAMKDRAEGRFDDYLKQHIEDTFGDGQDTSQSSREQSVVNHDMEATGDNQPVPANLLEQGNPSPVNLNSVQVWNLSSVGNKVPNPRSIQESTSTSDMQNADS